MVFVLTPLAANGNAAAHLNFTVTPRHVKDKWDSIFSEFIDLRVQASLGNSPRYHTWIHRSAMERIYNIVPESLEPRQIETVLSRIRGLVQRVDSFLPAMHQMANVIELHNERLDIHRQGIRLIQKFLTTFLGRSAFQSFEIDLRLPILL